MIIYIYISLIHDSLTLQPCAGDPRRYGHLAIRWLQRCLRWEDSERQRVYTMGMGGIQPGLRQRIQSWISDVAGLAGLEFSRVLSFCQFCPAKTYELLTAIGSSFHLESESWRFFFAKDQAVIAYFSPCRAPLSSNVSWAPSVVDSCSFQLPMALRTRPVVIGSCSGPWWMGSASWSVFRSFVKCGSIHRDAMQCKDTNVW